VREKARGFETVAIAVQLPERDVPDYIEADHSKLTAKFLRTPKLTDVPYAVKMEPNLVVEFYSR
jgi:small subunit ribosomal protein S4